VWLTANQEACASKFRSRVVQWRQVASEEEQLLGHRSAGERRQLRSGLLLFILANGLAHGP
jgi:hypothetical protein